MTSGTAQREPGFAPYVSNLLVGSFLLSLLPIFALTVALWINSMYLLQFDHVISGGTWTGIDIFMGVALTRTRKALKIPARVEVAKRPTPAKFYIVPSLSATGGVLK